MENKILSLVACEMQSVVCCLQAERNAMHKFIVSYIMLFTAMSDGSIHDWSRQFKNGCTEKGDKGAITLRLKTWFTKLTNLLEKTGFYDFRSCNKIFQNFSIYSIQNSI